MIKKCKKCGIEFSSELNMNYYCSNLCRSRDKFVIIKKDKEFKVWKKNYDKYQNFYDSLQTYKDRLKNKCFICEIEFENFSMCCSKDCSKIMKKESTFITTGSAHNLSNESAARKNMEYNIKNKYGVENVFQIDDVKKKLKETWNIKYGYSNPSKVDYIKNKKRKTAEKNGFWIPKELMDDRKIYEENIYNITWSQMKQYGYLKFGKNLWDIISESKKLENKKWITVDHRFSKNEGFLKKISPEIIGHICNLELMEFSDNRKKWMNSSVTLDSLLEEINEFEKILKFNK